MTSPQINMDSINIDIGDTQVSGVTWADDGLDALQEEHEHLHQQSEVILRSAAEVDLTKSERRTAYNPVRAYKRASTNVTIETMDKNLISSFTRAMPRSSSVSSELSEYSEDEQQPSVTFAKPNLDHTDTTRSLRESDTTRSLTESFRTEDDGSPLASKPKLEGADSMRSLVTFAPQLETVFAPKLETVSDDSPKSTKSDTDIFLANVDEDYVSVSSKEHPDEDAEEQGKPFMPTIIEATVVRDSSSESKIGFRIKRGVNGGVMIYHVDQDSLAAKSGLSEGDEILAVNGTKVYEPFHCITKLMCCFEHGGKANILASKGERPRGYSYILARKMHHNITGTTSSPDNVIDGLRLEEKAGKVKVAHIPSFTSSSFHGLNINRGDVVCGMNGIPITSILWAKIAWKVAAGPLVPILTYNHFRRFRLALMAFLPVAMKFNGGKRVGASIKIEDEYDIHEKLGEGAFAVVKAATHKATGENVAIKIINRACLSISEDEAIKNEIVILKELDHDNILNFHMEVVTLSNYYLVMECLYGGTLFDHIGKKNSYTESEARDICIVLFDTLSYIHSKGIAHRDLKPGNILLKHEDRDSDSIKIVDFGFAKVAPDDHSLITLCGSPGYCAPEILRRNFYGTKADMWSMGVIMFFLIGGHRPFEAYNEQELHRLCKAGSYSFDSQHWDNVSNGAKDTIRSLLVTNPGQRASAKEVLTQPWMVEEKETLMNSSLHKSQKELRRFASLSKFVEAETVRVANKRSAAKPTAAFSGRDKRRSIVLTPPSGDSSNGISSEPNVKLPESQLKQQEKEATEAIAKWEAKVDPNTSPNSNHKNTDALDISESQSGALEALLGPSVAQDEEEPSNSKLITKRKKKNMKSKIMTAMSIKGRKRK